MNVLEHSSRTLYVSILVLFLFASPLFVASLHVGATSTSSTGVIVPLYSYPTNPAWEEIIQAKVTNPSVPMIAIINPSNGPGTSQDLNYSRGINSLRSAGVMVIGYVHTSYGRRSLSSVEADINAYHQWYNLSGIFFDEMTNVSGYEIYYSTLNNYTKSLGYTLTVGNPGTRVQPSYDKTMDILTIYENKGLPSVSSITSWTSSSNKSSFAIMAYGVPNINSSFESSASSYGSWIYITDAGLPNPYHTLPSYFASEVASLSSITVRSTQTTTVTITKSSSANATTYSNAINFTNPATHYNMTTEQNAFSGTVQGTSEATSHGVFASVAVMMLLGSIPIISGSSKRRRP